MSSHDLVRQRKYLDAMGITWWQGREVANSVGVTNGQDESEIWASLEHTIKRCDACDLCKGRTQAVVGVGAKDAKLMIVGEGPGFYEDQKGEPFVGRAGQLLNAMLQAIDVARKAVYITNVIKCRPPNNRDPRPIEVESCTPFLEQQIALIRPHLMVALGRHAAHYLLDTNVSLGRLRDKTHRWRDQVPLIVTYHPAYLLRNPSDKGKAYQDWLKINQMLV